MIKKVSYGWINRFTEIQFIARPFYDDDVVLADRKTLDAKWFVIAYDEVFRMTSRELTTFVNDIAAHSDHACYLLGRNLRAKTRKDYRFNF